ncbi:GH3 auxin-responsive promoter [Halomicronema hongdechloris C2206]|uniref:GH3 auxin-responsive promoter n=1 Tax=Halomicronema hongdechloris C2206 TaxID=1641165 RepID=A0A1Z3HM54_9CYAN|nr:GH3 auxin-responsive promoter family protein [Halomicronema hongdechloris]ASC71368.1 GH3 auxin-responsive promoter [Halomicronema hongdechloris C2206]
MAARWRQRRFLAKLPRAASIQERFLQRLLTTHQDTALGQALGLSSVTTLEQFRQRLPIGTYADYAEYFERTAAGETNVVSPDPVVYINVSSGSTGRQKLVPVTVRSHRHRVYANQVTMGFGFAAAQRRQLQLHKLLFTAAATPLGHTAGGIPYGHISSHQLRTSSPLLHRQIFAQPFQTLQLADSFSRTYISLLFALAEPRLSIIAAIFPAVALRLCHYLETEAESLLDDLARGQLSPRLPIDPGYRRHLGRQLSPAPDRAAQLRESLQAEGRLLPRHAWPHLAFVATARGGPSDFYLERFPEYFGDCPVFGGTYSASEAVFGGCCDFDTDGALLAIESNFFEFIPVDDTASKTVLLPHELTLGEQYRLLVTNYSGFYRYDIGDIVEVVGWQQGVPLITFRYRRGGTLSAISEKTTEEHVIQVMAALQRQHALAVEDFCLTLSSDILAPYYVLNMELSAPGPTGMSQINLETWLVEFDRQLQRANPSYGLKRQAHDIRPPQLNLLSPGSFRQLRRQRLAPGQADDAQVKLPHISEQRTLLEGLSVLQQIHCPLSSSSAA